MKLGCVAIIVRTHDTRRGCCVANEGDADIRYEIAGIISHLATNTSLSQLNTTLSGLGDSVADKVGEQLAENNRTVVEKLDLLLAQTREHGASLVLVTHSDAAAARADRVLRLTADGIAN